MIRRLAILLAVAVLGACATQALAEQTKFPTRPTIKLKRSTGQDVIFGKVRSQAHACEAKRKVKLHHAPVTQEVESGVIARVRTNSKGKWTFKAKPNQNGERYARPGYYRAKVGEKKVSTGNGEILCKERNSSVMFVG